MSDFKGEYIWIIGCSSGIGAALAKKLASEGAILALSARREEKLQELKAELQGDEHLVVPLDVSDEKAVESAMQTISAAFPRLDRAIFLAAIYNAHDGKPKELDFMHKALQVNIGGVFNMMHFLTPFYEKQGKGQVVICASVAGYRGLPTGQPYCATKAALNNYAESLYLELKPKNINVKVINPGFVETPLTEKNDFTMPMIIKTEEAADYIAKGLKGGAFEIHFPKRFTFIMKLISILPKCLYFPLAARLIK
jgi:short-subunit dehydrogenase